MLTEVNFRPSYQHTCLFHEVAGYLYEREFHFVRLYEIINDPGGFWWLADALFVHRSLLDRIRTTPWGDTDARIPA
ncbi:hypothetical protein D3C83_153460 [compost metagenome]